MPPHSLDWDPRLYQQKHGFVYGLVEDLVKLLDPLKGERILDLGCGSGQLTQTINDYGVQVTGLDQSQAMVEEAKRQFPNIHFEVGDATNFNLDFQFDAIFSNAVLHWVLDYQAAIDCMFRNLKHGGRLVLEFGGKGNIQRIEQQLRASLESREYIAQAKFNQWYFPSIGEYSAALESAGFEVRMATHFDRPTELVDPDNAIKDWLMMFANSFFKGIPENDKPKILDEVQARLKPSLFWDGKWHADHRRIRVLAVKLPVK